MESLIGVKWKNRSSPLVKGKEYFYTYIHPATDCIAKPPVCDYMTMKFILLLCLNHVDTISIICIHVFSASARSYIRLTKLWSRSYIFEHERFMWLQIRNFIGLYIILIDLILIFWSGLSDVAEAYKAAMKGATADSDELIPEKLIQDKAHTFSENLRTNRTTALSKIQDGLQYLSYVVLSTSIPSAW